MTLKTRFALVGAGGRASNFINPIVARFPRHNQLVGLCDTNHARLDWHNRQITQVLKGQAVPTFDAPQFDRMIRETRPDVVIVTTVDAFHHQYITRAMTLGCDVITEKPMTIDDKKCRAILAAVTRTRKKLRVTFNYRWTPGCTLVKQLLAKGTIGQVISVDMEYLLNTSHGADYFRRWHREKDKSGGLMVHKATHHFDLINWWIDAVPEEVFGYGRLAFYGRENAKRRGIKVKHHRYTGHDTAGDPFALDLDAHQDLRGLYREAEKHDGYLRDRNVFGDNITVEDTMSLLVKYRTGVALTYSLNAFLPREGFHVVFNGTHGRLEYNEDHGMHVIEQDKKRRPAGPQGHDLDWRSRCIVHPLFRRPYEVPIPVAEGGHGGSDALLCEQLFSPRPPRDPWGRGAGHQQGAASILIGIAANRCFATGKPVQIARLCPALPKATHLHELI